MSNQKFYTVQKEINGVTYTAQFNGLKAALNAVDVSYIQNSSNISTTKLTEYILDNVIVEPKGLSIDDFKSMEELNEVIGFGRDVMQGKFRETQDKESVKETSKK